MTVSENQRQLLDDLLVIEDRQERLAIIIDRARGRPALPEADRVEANRVHGCQSQVWLVARREGSGLAFVFDADSPLVKGLVALLCDLHHGAAPDDVLSASPTLVEELGLPRELTPTRVNGLAAVQARIRALAAALA